MERVKAAIRDVPDFPKKGIMFKDITPVLQDAELLAMVVDDLVERYRGRGISKVVGIESRGFIFGTPIAVALGAGFVPLRKKGKLPYKTLSHSFELEYGSETIEIHEDGIEKGERVLIVDDLLATGGTAEAAMKLVRRCGGEVVEVAFVVELSFLNGRARLEGVPVYSQVVF